MYLSKLDIVGFKSFAQKTQLKFTGGISAIVGPNGCGKTNIVDAIRWVLGEQKTSVLRSDVMENVIFNGTRTRKPLSMAEVTLTIENTKNILPTEFSEVTITRRLFRSGESEYLLNRTKVRLRDIIDLFMDTGLGSDSYSVIELKMVEAILSGRAEERRQLFEEAAGIKKYKMRRKEAAKKLDSVMQDLTRVNDILEEVRKNVGSLSRQASKTRRYNSLMSEYKDLEIRLLDFHFESLRKNLDILQQSVGELNKSKIKQEFELDELEKSLTSLKLKYNDLDSRFVNIQNEENRLLKEIAENKREVAVATEKLLSIDNQKIRLSEEISEADKNVTDSLVELGELSSLIEEKKKHRSILEEKLQAIREERDSILSSLADAKRIVDKANETVYSMQSTLNNYKSQSARLTERKSTLQKKIQGSFEESYKIQNQINEVENELGGCDQIRKELALELDEAEHLLNSEKERLMSLEASREKLKLKLAEKRNILGNKNSSLDFLKSLIDTNETAKHLIKSDAWSVSTEKIQLAEAIAVDDDYRLAVLSALNNIGDYFFVETRTEALKAISILANDKKGKTAIFSRDSIRMESDLTTHSDKYKSLYEIIRAEDDVKLILKQILGNCIVVDSLDEALLAVSSDASLDLAIAKTGEMVHKSGFIFGGSFNKNDSGKLGKKEKMDGLRKEISALKEEISQLENELDELGDEIKSIDIASLNSAVRSAELKLKTHDQKKAQLELRLQALNQSLELLGESNARIEEEIEEITTETEKLTENANTLAESLENARRDQNDSIKKLKESESKLDSVNEKNRNIDVELAALRSEISSIENDHRKVSVNISNYKVKSQRLNEELLSSDAKKISLSETISTANELLLELEKSLASTSALKESLSFEKSSASEQITLYSDNLSFNRTEYDKIKESIHTKDIKISEILVQIKTIADRFAEEYQIIVDDRIIVLDENFNPENAKTTIVELKNKLSALGNVNFMALEEFEKESERLSFYENQVADLVKSEKTLKETIEEINRTAEKLFLDTFNKIHVNFKKLFQTLFGEDGEAELRINETNILETDIEIMAKPPNKRPNSIEQLSGGEKTLTAIALLFAIYLVKPSPFCILDEVDAPLDDANIEKFVKLIKEFSNETQFLIVSHNKKTMTAADTLYGVTMQEVGVSKTVSVALNQTEEKF